MSLPYSVRCSALATVVRFYIIYWMRNEDNKDNNNFEFKSMNWTLS
jgi:hypothetical protein